MSNFSRTARPFSACRSYSSATCLSALTLVVLSMAGQSPSAAEPAPPGDLSVTPAAVPEAPATTAVDLASLVVAAKRSHPTAQAIAAARRAATASADQAGIWANPEVELSLGRTRPRVADLESDLPFGGKLSQRVEWWAKRRARVAVAAAQVATADAEAAAALLDLEVEVRLAAIAVATAQAVAGQAAIQASLAQELSEVMVKRQVVGDLDRGQSARVRLEATTARLRHEAAVRNVALRVAALKAWCGEIVSGDIAISDALGDPQVSADGQTQPAASVHPRIRAAIAAERAAEAHAEAERQARIPDVTIGVFGDREREKDSYGASLGFEIPLWDRGGARIAAADAAHEQRAAERALAALTLAREQAIAFGDWTASAAEVLALRDQAVPVAEEAQRLRLSAFQVGDASVADVLEARRAALAVQADLLDARRRHAEAQVRLLAATGVGGQP